MHRQPAGKAAKAEKQIPQSPKDAARAEKAAAKAEKVAKARPGVERKSARPRLPPKDYQPRLQEYYYEVVAADAHRAIRLQEQFEVPVIEKIVLNMGVGEGVNDRRK